MINTQKIMIVLATIAMLIITTAGSLALTIDVVGDNADGGIRNGHNITDDYVSIRQQAGQTFNIAGSGTYTLNSIATRLSIVSFGSTPVRVSLYDFNGTHPVEPALAYSEIDGSLLNETPQRFTFPNLDITLNYNQTYMFVLSSDDENAMTVIVYYNNTAEYTDGVMYQNAEDLNYGWQLYGGSANLDFLMTYTSIEAPQTPSIPANPITCYDFENNLTDFFGLQDATTTCSASYATGIKNQGISVINTAGSVCENPRFNTNIDFAEGWNIEIWSNVTAVDGSAIILELASTQNNGIFITGTELYAQFAESGGNQIYRASQNVSGSADGLWHQYVLAFDGTDVKFYYDGAYVPVSIGSETVVSQLAYMTNSVAWFGAFPFGYETTATFDVVKVYNGTLNATDVTYLYNSGDARKCEYAQIDSFVAECTDDNDCGTCQKCSAQECVYQTTSEDTKNECSNGITGCTNAYSFATQDGFCNGAGTCTASNTNVALGNVCIDAGNSDVAPTVAVNCGIWSNCTTGLLTAPEFYVGYEVGGATCNTTNWQSAGTYQLATTNYSFDQTGAYDTCTETLIIIEPPQSNQYTAEDAPKAVINGLVKIVIGVGTVAFLIGLLAVIGVIGAGAGKVFKK